MGYKGLFDVPFIGKLEALAILLQKLRSEGRRVLILSQMVLMLDILEMFLDFHHLTYVRIDENANREQRQVRTASPVLSPVTWCASPAASVCLGFSVWCQPRAAMTLTDEGRVLGLQQG